MMILFFSLLINQGCFRHHEATFYQLSLSNKLTISVNKANKITLLSVNGKSFPLPHCRRPRYINYYPIRDSLLIFGDMNNEKSIGIYLIDLGNDNIEFIPFSIPEAELSYKFNTFMETTHWYDKMMPVLSDSGQEIYLGFPSGNTYVIRLTDNLILPTLPDCDAFVASANDASFYGQAVIAIYLNKNKCKEYYEFINQLGTSDENCITSFREYHCCPK